MAIALSPRTISSNTAVLAQEHSLEIPYRMRSKASEKRYTAVDSMLTKRDT